MDNSLELRELFAIVFKRKWLILFITLLFFGLGVFYSRNMVTPLYQSSTTLMVNSLKGVSGTDAAMNFSLSTINLSQRLVLTYSEIIQSRSVAEKVIMVLELDMSVGQLSSMINVVQVGDTEILKIKIIDTDPERAVLIANTTARVFVKEVMRIIKVDNVEIIDKAIPIYYPINLKTTLNVTVTTLVGIVLSVFLVFLLDYSDRSLKTEGDIEKHLKLNVLGSIPEYTREMKKAGEMT